MWSLFRKRHEDDLRRLISAYRYYLKAADQAGSNQAGEGRGPDRAWKGGFGKTYKQLFKDWPSPNESRRFEKKVARWLKKNRNLDEAYLLAFNDYLNQKRLSPDELSDVIERGRQAYYR